MLKNSAEFKEEDLDSPRDYSTHAYFQWERIETQGLTPCKRYAHCCHFYSELNSLIIYGGR